jgi:hypothetical protein
VKLFGGFLSCISGLRKLVLSHELALVSLKWPLQVLLLNSVMASKVQ